MLDRCSGGSRPVLVNETYRFACSFPLAFAWTPVAVMRFTTLAGDASADVT